VNAPYYMGGLASSRTFGHTGFTGTSIVIDPHRELVIVLLTNRVHPTRHGPDVNPVRRAVADAVLEAIDAT
jgi:CubicO group peptidase (beta-lactamase class C family)